MSIAIPIFTLAIIIATWEIIDMTLGIRKILLPAPHEIALAFKDNWRILFKETGITMLESVLGFILGTVIAFMLATSFVYSLNIRLALYPYAVALKSTPLIAIAPLLVLWFGNGLVSKIVMASLVSFFPVLVNSVDGLLSIDKESIDLMKSLSASRWQIFWKIRFPSCLPNLFSSLKIASSLAVVGAVIGEFTGSVSGIGHLINTSSYYLETDLMFAGIFFISLSGIIFFGIISLLEKKIVFWEKKL